MHAAVAEMIPPQRLGAAYGVFGAAFGVAWFLRSAAMQLRARLKPAQP